MSRMRLVVAIGGTALWALAIGYLVQDAAGPGAAASAPTPAATRPAQPQQAVIAPTAAEIADENPTLELDFITYTSAQPDVQPPRPLSAPAPDGFGGQGAAAAADCPIAATARPAPKASVVLVVEAPCDRNARVTIHHNGMMFTEKTDAAGRLELSVPALSERAVFIAAFAGGKGAVAATQVPDLAGVERVALQWSGKAGFELHALEFGAGYDDPGHVWFGSGGPAAGAQGWLVRLGRGDLPASRQVDVYTFPAATSVASGMVKLSVEAEITALNCGREISAQSLELRGGFGRLRTREISLSMPDCSAKGDFLVLNNLVEDLKIASR